MSAQAEHIRLSSLAPPPKLKNLMKRSNITTLSLPWHKIGSTLPNLAQFIRLSLQKLRLEYEDKEAMLAIWHELGKKIGRRGCLQVDGLFEMGCGANPSTRIDSAKHPTEAARLKELYAAPTVMTQQAAAYPHPRHRANPPATTTRQRERVLPRSRRACQACLRRADH